MRPYWKMLRPATMMSPPFTALASATGVHDFQKGLLPYADRSNLLGHRMFEESRRLRSKANVVTRLDFCHEFIDVSRMLGPASGASGMYRRD
jgi:hypothetical protein